MGQPLHDAKESNILSIGYDGVFEEVISSGCTVWKLPHTTILAFFFPFAPSGLGLTTNTSLPGKISAPRVSLSLTVS